jgi:hypothetical protein
MIRLTARRRAVSFLAVLVLAGATAGIVAEPAGSQVAQTFTVVKVVSGTAPSTASYVVHVACANGFANNLNFPAAGSFGPLPNPGGAVGSCTFTEVVTGGATSSAGACSITSGTAVCGGGGTSPVTLTFSGVSFSATVTFTNTFVAPPTTTVPTTTPPAPVIVAPARFTG